MWYWLRKIEGFMFIPPFVFYYIIRGIPFFTRCRKCNKRLFDQQFIREGMCALCTSQMASANTSEFYKPDHIVIRHVSPSQNHHDRRTLNKIGYGKVLDVGCSYGRLLSRVGKQRDLYGIDMSAESIKVARVWVQHGNFCIGDARSIPYLSGSFDYLVCTEVLEHISDDSIIKECFRVLKPNGVAIITVPNGNGPSGRYFPYHIRLFSFQTLSKAMEDAGFEIINGYKFGLFILFFTRFFEMISLAFGRNLPFSPILNIKVPEFLADQFFIECKKPAVYSETMLSIYKPQL